jgi:hypothetical protein
MSPCAIPDCYQRGSKLVCMDHYRELVEAYADIDFSELSVDECIRLYRELSPHRVYRCDQCHKRRVGSRLKLPPSWMKKRSEHGFFCNDCRMAYVDREAMVRTQTKVIGKAGGTRQIMTPLKTK